LALWVKQPGQLSLPSIQPLQEAYVGGVAQWLGRRSLAGGLSLIYAYSMLDFVTTSWAVVESW